MKSFLLSSMFALVVSGYASGVPSPYDYFADKNEAALTEAAIDGDTATESRLIRGGVNANAVSKDGLPILGWAYLANNKAGFRTLLDEHANPEISIARPLPRQYVGNSVIEMAILTRPPGGSYWFEQLYEHGANPNFVIDVGTDYTVIFAAIRNNRDDLVSVLVTHGANLNKRWAGETPLICTVDGGIRLKASLVLLRGGADWAPLDSHGKSFFDYLYVYGARLENNRMSFPDEYLEVLRWFSSHNVKLPENLKVQLQKLSEKSG